MDSADKAAPEVAEVKTERLTAKIEKLKQQMQKLKGIEAQLHESTDQQISLTDLDARSMATSGRGTGTVGTAVDDKHHLIIAHGVTTVGNDRAQLSNMANQAREEIGAEGLTVVADRGYYKDPEILACEQAGITTFVPKPLTSSSKAVGRCVCSAAQIRKVERKPCWVRCPTAIRGLCGRCYWRSSALAFLK